MIARIKWRTNRIRKPREREKKSVSTATRSSKTICIDDTTIFATCEYYKLYLQIFV